MEIESSQIAARMSEKITDLLQQRGRHLAAVADINSQLHTAYRALGLDPAEIGVPNKGGRLPSISSADRYPLQPNTMGSYMIEILQKADKGYGRRELRGEIEKEPRYGAQLRKNVNVYYNLINRYLKNRRIVDVGGLIYHPDRAPLAAGESDPTGSHLPANVSLFPDRRANDGGD